MRVYTRHARSSSWKNIFRFGLGHRKGQHDAEDNTPRSSLDKDEPGEVVTGRETPDGDGDGETPRASSERSIVQVDDGGAAGTRVVEREVPSSAETIDDASEEMPSWDVKDGEETVVELRFHSDAHREFDSEMTARFCTEVSCRLRVGSRRHIQAPDD